MSRKKIMPTMKWEDALDTVDPETVAKILGCCFETAKKYFNEKDFPLLDKCGLKADKEAARLYFQGIRFKGDNGKNALLSMIYFELKKLNSKMIWNEAEEKIS